MVSIFVVLNMLLIKTKLRVGVAAPDIRRVGAPKLRWLSPSVCRYLRFVTLAIRIGCCDDNVVLRVTL